MFIEITIHTRDAVDKPIFINLSHIVTMESQKGKSLILLADGTTVVAEEPLRTLIERIKTEQI
jgi:hypothetical protein